MITPSTEQQAIVNEINTPTSRHLRIEAVAGSGKTTTIEMAMKELPPLARAQYMAFNKRNVEDILLRMGDGDARVEVATFNSTGYRALRRHLDFSVAIKSGKTFDMIEECLDTRIEDRHVRGCISRVVGLCKGTLVMPEHDEQEIWHLLDYMGMSVDEPHVVVQAASEILKCNWEYTEENQIIDFDDQLYLPIYLNAAFQKKTHLFVDECQDTNNANFEMIKRMLTDHGRVFLVGDSHQAIYGFRGANADAMEIMSKHFEAGDLTLPVTYRCSKSITKLAQEYVPHIRAREGAEEGSVNRPDSFDLLTLLPHDMVLCRLNSPLMPVAWRLLELGKPFNLLGKDLQAKLERTIKKVCGKEPITATNLFLKKFERWLDKEIEKLIKREAYGLVHMMEDEANCMRFLCSKIRTVAELKDNIQHLFQSKHGIALSTVHKAKGAEADHVLILDAQLYMPFMKATTVWEKQQEDNIFYVAITRAKRDLTFINTSDIDFGGTDAA